MNAAELAGIATARTIYPAMESLRLAKLIADNAAEPLGESLMFCTRQEITNELRRFDASRVASTNAGL